MRSVILLRAVLVTGASSGIGEATAIFLAHKGFRVFAAGRRIEKLKALSSLAKNRITPVAMDITDDNSIREALKDITKFREPLYGLVNNAGIGVMGPIEMVPQEDWRRQYETNVFGLMNITRAVLPQMRDAKRGRIVNIGSISGRIALPFQGVYASSKHAVEGLSDALRRELKPFGVKVSVVRPGFVKTDFGKQEQWELSKYDKKAQPYSEYVKRFKKWHSTGHPTGISPNIVAQAVHRALTSERPYSRYTLPNKILMYLLLRNLAPSIFTDRIISNAVGINHGKN